MCTGIDFEIAKPLQLKAAKRMIHQWYCDLAEVVYFRRPGGLT